MPYMDPTTTFDGSADTDEVKKRRAAQAAQATTNSTLTSQMGQQQAQPAGGNAGDALPEPYSASKQLASTIAGGGTARKTQQGGFNMDAGSQPWQYTPQAPAAPAAAPAPQRPATPPPTSTVTTTVPREQFDAAGYLAANPDVAAAIRAGQFNRDPYAHYTQYGAREGRPGATAAPAGTPSGTPQTNTSAYNTDGYAAPQYVVPASGAAPAGWDQTKWADPNHQTPKYGVGRILTQYAPTVEGLAQAMPDITRAYPGATLVGRDKVNIPGVGTIDVLRNSVNGGDGWQWLDPNAPADPSAMAQMGAAGTTGMPGAGGAAGSGYGASTYSAPGYQAPAAPAATAPIAAPTYQAGEVPQFNPADLSAIIAQLTGMANEGVDVNVPTYTAGAVDQFAGGAGGDALSQALAALTRAAGSADPNVAGQKESAKETLLAARQAERDAMLGGAAMNGRLGSGAVAALDAQRGDAFAGNLTDAYRTIEAEGQQRGFTNQLNLGSALQGLGATQGSESRADYASTLAGQQAQEQLRQIETQLGLQAGSLTAALQAQQFGQLSDVANLTGNEARANYATTLAGTTAQEQMKQAEANSGQSAAQILAQQLAQQRQLELQYAQLEQQAAQIAAQMGFNYAQLSQQDKQYFAQLAQQESQFGQTFGLNSAIAGNNANNDFMRTLLGMFE